MTPTTPPLVLKLKNKPDRDERITLASFGIAAAGWSELVRRVTLEQSGARSAVEWVIAEVHVGSLEVALAPIARSEQAESVEREVATIVVNGLDRIEHGYEPFEVFSLQAGEAARQLVSVLSDSVDQVLVSNRDREVSLSREGAGRLADKPSKFISLGSVEGILKTVSFSEARPYFSVFRSLDGRAVRCYFDERRHLDTVLELLRARARIAVRGRVARREDGTPVSVSDIKEIRALRSRDDLPQIRDLVGIDPDLTEGLRSEEWLRRRRG